MAADDEREDTDESEDTGRPAVVQRAIDFLKVAVKATDKQHKREIDDLKFQIPELQWDADSRTNRAGMTVAGIPIPARPMLSIATIDEPINLVANQERAAHLGINIHPLTEDATDDTAEVLQGLYRTIEVQSRANNVRSWAFDRALKCGRGCYRILTEYDPYSAVPGDQRIVIKRVLYQDSVFVDPFAQEMDFSDMHKAEVTSDVPFDRYKREHPKSQLAKYGESDLKELVADWEGGDATDWIGGDDELSRTVRVAELYELEFDESEEEITDAKGKKSTIPKLTPKLRWTKVNAIEVLDERVTAARYIPIVMMVGRELQPFDKERNWAGMIRNAKDGVRLTNYAASNAVEMAAMEPKAPYQLDPRQIEGYEAFWQQLNMRNLPYLPSHRVIDGQVVEAPQRTQVDVSRLGPSMQLLSMGRDFIQGATATYDPALGKQPTAHRSGRAIVALQDQTVEGTSHYLDNEANVSLPYEAMIVLDLMPMVYDRPGRVVKILTGDDKQQNVMLNAPFVMQSGRPQPVTVPNPNDPNTRTFAPADHPQMPQEAKHFDLSKGRYGVSVTIGKTSKGRLQQGQDAIGQVISADPAMMMPLLGPEWLAMQDFPGAKKASEIVGEFRAHQFPFLGQQQGTPDPRALMQQNQALKAQLQELGQKVQGKVIENQGKAAIEEVKQSHEDMRAAMDRETKLAVAELGAKVDRLQLFLEERARVGSQQHEADQAQADRAHDVGMAAMDQQNASEQGAQDHSQTMQQADQQHQQALVQGAQPPPVDPNAQPDSGQPSE